MKAHIEKAFSTVAQMLITPSVVTRLQNYIESVFYELEAYEEAVRALEEAPIEQIMDNEDPQSEEGASNALSLA